MKKLPKVLVAHPIYRMSPSVNFYLGMIDTVATYPGGLDIRLGTDFSAVKARNDLVIQFLKSDCEYLFFVDLDIGLPRDGLRQLVEDDVPIVGGLYFERIPPHNPMIFEKGEFTEREHRYLFKRNYPEGLTEVDATGAGALLVKKEVFKNLTPPYFYQPEIAVSEDFFFCERAKERGYKVYVDTSVKCTHYTEMIVNEQVKRFYDERF